MHDKDIDRQMVKALNAMEEAIQILEDLRKESGERGPKLGKGERELWAAYNIIMAKRPLIREEQ